MPALFADWAGALVDAAGVVPGQAVLDVACGTGIVARTVADRLQGDGRVIGVDVNDAMLAVARRARPELEWLVAEAGDLPFPDASFDTVLCQAALMYFPDRARAVAEMARVVRSGGAVAVQLWSALESQPAYVAFAEIVTRHAGEPGRELIGSYFSLGDAGVVTSLFEQAGLEPVSTVTRRGAVRAPSLEEFVRSEIDGTPLADQLGDEQYAAIMDETVRALAPFAADGHAEVPIDGHILVALR